MNIYKKITDLEESNQSFVVATVIDASGSVPGKIGFKMLITNDNTFGTVGGGAIELEVITQSRALLVSGENKLQKYILSKNNVKTKADEKVLPMMCNGKVTIFYECFGRKPVCYVFGGGHVGQALLKLLPPLGYHSLLIDNREEYANANTCPNADKYILSEYEPFANEHQFLADSYVVILTHGHSFDYKILKILYERKLELKYIGAIASKAKSSEFKRNLKKEFGKDIDLQKLHSPVGLNIGGTSASEIAMSIAAEMQSVRYGKSI